jgi:hypothetical protein
MRERRRIADFWDQVVNEFLNGGLLMREPLDVWFQAYEGSGDGAVDRDAMPEAYCGPLLGDPRSVFLGLNPGTAIPAYQYRNGILADEIRKTGRYSDVYRTTPAKPRTMAERTWSKQASPQSNRLHAPLAR